MNLEEISNNQHLLEIARQAVEQQLIERRNDRLSILRNNGLVIKESNGEPSHIIRLSIEQSIQIALRAIHQYRISHPN